MNIFTKNINWLLRFAFIALAIGAFSLTAQAGSLNNESTTQVNSSSVSGVADLQESAVQSLLPSCGDEVAASGADTGLHPSLSDCERYCNCCDHYGYQWCCDHCNGCKSLTIPNDAT